MKSFTDVDGEDVEFNGSKLGPSQRWVPGNQNADAQCIELLVHCKLLDPTERIEEKVEEVRKKCITFCFWLGSIASVNSETCNGYYHNTSCFTTRYWSSGVYSCLYVFFLTQQPLSKNANAKPTGGFVVHGLKISRHAMPKS